MGGDNNKGALPLTSLNHISVLCRSVEKSVDFYQNVLGFFPVRRPGSLDFHGACLPLTVGSYKFVWDQLLFNFGIGIHLLKSTDLENVPKKKEINPKDNHISFQCDSMYLVENQLKDMGIQYIKCRVEESGIYFDQLFFHDPDGFMIEICNCDNLPVIPLTNNEPAATVCKNANFVQNQQQLQKPASNDFLVKLHVEEPQINCA